MKLDTFINRPVLSTVISIFIVVLGFIGMVSLPVEQFPDIAPPTISVSTNYTGANAQTVLNSVIAPLEEEINGAEGMQYMTSKAANSGRAEISVLFDKDRDPDMAAVDVQNRVSKALSLLPAEVTKVGVQVNKRQSSMLMAVALYSPDGKYDKQFLENYAKINLVPEIKRVSGVGEAMVMGADYSMRIWLKPEVMAQYSLMPDDVVAALSEQNIEAAPGQLGERGDQTFQYTLKYKGRLEKPEEFENIVLRANSDGTMLRLGDVAEVELGRSDYGFQNQYNGMPAVTTMVFQTAGSNATTVIDNVLALLDKAKKDLPPGIDIAVPMNNNVFLDASINNVLHTLFEAFVLVFVVVYIFLQDIRSTIIPAIAIPVALIGTFFLMNLIGFSINLITLSALVLAIAIVVDDAIVVVEAVHAKLDAGYKSARRASIDAMNEISGAIVSITLVMMLVFIPVSFMPGTSGVFYRQFGLTMAIAIFFSAINALTLSPALCAVFLKPHDDGPSKKLGFVKRFHTAFNAGYGALLHKYQGFTKFFIRFKAVSALVVATAIGILVWLMTTTPTAMVPDEDTGMMFAVVDMPPATAQERTGQVLQEVDSIVRSVPGVQSSTLIEGYSLIAGQGSTYGTLIVKLKDWKDRDKSQSVTNIIQQLYGMTAMKIKDGRVMFFAPPMIMGYSITNGFSLQLQDKTGGSVDDFYAVAMGFIGALNQQPEIQMAYTTFNPTFPQYMVEINVDKAKQAGLSPQSLLSTLQGYYGGMYVSNFNRFGKLYRVMLQAAPEARINPETLASIKVRNGSEMAPITNFIKLQRVYGPDILARFNMYTSIAVNGSPNPGYSSGDAIAAINRVADQMLPAGYGFDLDGMTREEQKSSAGGTAIIFGLCLLFVYLLLSAQYESYFLPWAVILSIPFGLMGTFIFADIFDITNNVYLQIALIMLIGLLAKNAILIVEFAKDRRVTGMSIVNAAVDAASARLRPILMTSLALIIGLLPMMFASSVGANGNRALGAGSVGGMLIGMVLQVLIVPCLYVVFQKIQERFTPLKWEDTDNEGIESEIEQYASK